MTLSSALCKAIVRHGDRCALVATGLDLHQLLVCAGLMIAVRSRAQKEQPLLFCAKIGDELFLTLIECKHAAAVQNKDAFNREFCSVLSACSNATFECLLLALQADPPLPWLEFGLHAASHCALFDEQAGADAADFVCCVADSSRGSGLCSTASHQGKATDMFPLAFSLDSYGFCPAFSRGRVLLWIPVSPWRSNWCGSWSKK